MAISIKTDFRDYQPAYNKLEVCVDSTHSGNENFKYVFRVYVYGEAGYKQYEVVPEAVLAYGVLDIHNYIQTFVTAQIGEFDMTASFTYAQTSIIQYNVEYYEMWDVSGVPTLDPDEDGPVEGDDFYCTEASLNYEEWLDDKLQAYLLNTTLGTDGKWLTDWNNRKVSIDDLGWTYIMTDSPNDIDYMEVKTYNAAGVLIDTYQAENLLTKSVPNARFLKVSTAPQSLNNIGTLSLGSQPIIDDTVASYTVQIFESTPTAISELQYFELEEPCRYEVYRLHWENKYGGFDFYNFKGRNKTKQSYQKSSFKMSTYPIVTAGLDYKHQYKSNVNNWTKRVNKLSLSTDWLTSEEHENFKQLLYSNEIYLEFVDGNGDRNFKSVYNVNKTNWEQKVTTIDKLFKLDIELDIAQDAFSQRK